MITTVALVLAATPVSKASDSKATPMANGASQLGGALLGGAVISVRSAAATPAAARRHVPSK